MPAGLVTLFLGLILMALAFVPGSAVWKTLHDALFGVFGCGSFVVGAALCYLANMRSLGQPYLAPVAPWRPHNPDLLLRLPLWRQTRALFTARRGQWAFSQNPRQRRKEDA